MDKRGQFFLMAAFIIVGIIASLTTIVNVANVKPDNFGFYDLSREVSYETKYIVDYGIYNNYTKDGRDELVKSFLEQYSNYISQDQAVFLYGNEDGMNALYFALVPGSVGIITSDVGQQIVIPIGGVSGQEVQATITSVVQGLGTKVVSVEVGGNEYSFELKPGENFFFVIRKLEDGNQYVIAK